MIVALLWAVMSLLGAGFLFCVYLCCTPRKGSVIGMPLRRERGE
jgi:hypothetical protein